MTLGELCDLVAGRVTLVIELKSRFDGNPRLTARAAALLSAYSGPAAIMSFDPAQIETARTAAPALPRGLVAEHRRGAEHRLRYLGSVLRARLQFIAYSVKDLPAPLPFVARHVCRMPLLTWTVRDKTDRRRAELWADQIIFEGFRP
jgi:glycerophosphoryl diester phosphodiesterase